MAREVTATLIWARTWSAQRRCSAWRRARAVRTPWTMATATIAPESMNPRVDRNPPFAKSDKYMPEGTRASNTTPAVTRPSQRCSLGPRRRSVVDSKTRHAGNAKATVTTCTLRASSQASSSGSGSFSMTNGARSSPK